MMGCRKFLPPNPAAAGYNEKHSRAGGPRLSSTRHDPTWCQEQINMHLFFGSSPLSNDQTRSTLFPKIPLGNRIELFRPAHVEKSILFPDRKSTRLNSSHQIISYAV